MTVERTSEAEYRHVLTPITIRDVEVPNRIVRTAHATGLAMGGAGPDFVAYHAGPARSGVGLTILEAAAVHPIWTAVTPTGRLPP